MDDPVNGNDPSGLFGLLDLFMPQSAEAASLKTDMDNNATTFDPRPEDPEGKTFTIETHNVVTSTSDPGANDPFSTEDVRVIRFMPKGMQKSFGPSGAYIDTGDKRGRDVHGGGGFNRDEAIQPRQGWHKTKGCTRGQNEDVIEMGEKIIDFQKRHPEAKIPYDRFKSK